MVWVSCNFFAPRQRLAKKREEVEVRSHKNPEI